MILWMKGKQAVFGRGGTRRRAVRGHDLSVKLLIEWLRYREGSDGVSMRVMAEKKQRRLTNERFLLRGLICVVAWSYIAVVSLLLVAVDDDSPEDSVTPDGIQIRVWRMW